MTVGEVLRYAKERGVKISLRSEDRLIVRGPSGAIGALRLCIVAHKPELLVHLRAALAAEPAENTQQPLPECLWPTTAPICEFLIGYPGESCKRCGASWMEHYIGEDAS